MLKHTKWKNQDSKKVAQSKEFKKWLIKKVKKDSGGSIIFKGGDIEFK